MLGALFEDDVRAVAARGCLISYASILASPFCYVPHDAMTPGAVAVGDLAEVAAALAPRSLRIEEPVDGRNRRVDAEASAKALEPATRTYRATGQPAQFSIVLKPDKDLGRWLLEKVRH